MFSGIEPALGHPHQTVAMVAGQLAAILGNILKLRGIWPANNIAGFFSISLSSRSMRFSVRNRSFSRSSSASCARACAACAGGGSGLVAGW